MTRHADTVVWSPALEADVADAWLRSDPHSRRRLAEAADLADRLLASAPESVGRPLAGDPESWLCSLPDFDPPVGVIDAIDGMDRPVTVLRVIMLKDEWHQQQ